MANGNSRIVSKYIKVWRTQHTRPKDIHFLSDNMSLPGLLRPTIRNTFVGSSALSNDIQIQFQSHPMISFSSFKTPSFAKPTRRVTVKKLLTMEYSNDNIPPLRLTEKMVGNYQGLKNLETIPVGGIYDVLGVFCVVGIYIEYMPM